MSAKRAAKKAAKKKTARTSGRASTGARSAAAKGSKAAKRATATKRAKAGKPKATPAAAKKAKSTAKASKPAKSPKAAKKAPTRKTKATRRGDAVKAGVAKLTKQKTAPKAAKPRRKTRKGRPSYWSPAVARRLREKLLAKRRELIGSVISSAGDRREQKLDGTEDYIDYAVSSYDREFLLSLTELDQQELMLVEEALQRMNRGDYGFCLASAEEIPLKRLEVQPWARYSVRNQELVDQGMLVQDLLRFDPDAVADPLEGELDEDESDDEEDVDDDADDEPAEGGVEGEKHVI